MSSARERIMQLRHAVAISGASALVTLCDERLEHLEELTERRASAADIDLAARRDLNEIVIAISKTACSDQVLVPYYADQGLEVERVMREIESRMREKG